MRCIYWLEGRFLTVYEKYETKDCPHGTGLSQVQLAEMTDVTRQTIGMIEAGDFNPSLKLCIRICKALGKTLDDLFWEVE